MDQADGRVEPEIRRSREVGVGVHDTGHHPLPGGIYYVCIRRVSGIVVTVDAHDFAVLNSDIANCVEAGLVVEDPATFYDHLIPGQNAGPFTAWPPRGAAQQIKCLS